MDEVRLWEEHYHPVLRLRKYMEGRGLWDQRKDEEMRKSINTEVKTSISRARAELKPNPDEMFTDVYDQVPLSLERQCQQMWEHLKKYKEHYPELKDFEKGNSI